MYGEYPTFDLGLDLGKSRASKVLSGVEPNGPAFKAGLRDGQAVAAWDINGNDVERPATVTLLVDGTEQKVSYLPRGKQVAAWQYKIDKDQPCSAQK